jgi:hypothetical protein
MKREVDIRGKILRIGICEEKHRLMQELTSVIRELLAIQEQQIHAIVAKDPDFARFDILLEMTNSRKRTVKYAYLNHVETHGC